MMASRTTVLISAFLFLSLLPGPAHSGEPPLLTGVFPPGASVGREATWTLTGRDLGAVRSLIVDGVGLEVLALRHDAPARLTATVRVAPEAAPGFREIRLDGPDGASNALIVRIDPLPQEVEGEADDGREFVVGTAVVGRLTERDRDAYHFRGTPGERVAIDLEVRRLGFAFAPVVAVTSASGRAIAQGRESRGGDRDCRMTVEVPHEGRFVVEVRDNLYRGGDLAVYRLRVEPAPTPDPVPPEPWPISLSSDVPVAGVIGAPGAVATLDLMVKAGEAVDIRAEATLGSRLDTVLTVRDAGPAIHGDGEIRFVPDKDGKMRIEVADRFGGGGPDFGYLLRAGPPRQDFSVRLGLVVGRDVGPGHFGVFNVRPDSEVRVDVAIRPDGFAGPVEVRLVGLPEGARVDPITIRVPPESRNGTAHVVGKIWIVVEPAAKPGLGWFEVEAIGRAIDGQSIRQKASATVEMVPGSGVMRTIERFPIRVLGP